MVHFLIEEPLLLIGIFLAIGYIASIFLEKYLSIPHIITYLVTGVILSNLVFQDVILTDEIHNWVVISEHLALGLIGFSIGVHIKIDQIRKNRRFAFAVTFFETGMAFIIVSGIVFLVSRDILLAIILGGLATATAPASTMEVLRKFRTKGPLTTKVKWVLAFDDIVAILIVEGVLAYLIALVGGEITFLHYLEELWHEIGLAVLIGIIIGFLLDLIIETLEDNVEILEITLGILVLTIGLCFFIETSTILATMTIGIIAANRKGSNYEQSERQLELIMSPVLTIFFVLVGTRIVFRTYSLFPWIAFFYLLSRSLGKIIGAFIGAKLAGTDKIIRENIGLALLAQGGVSLGLSAEVDEILHGTIYQNIGTQVVSFLVISTFFSVGLGAIATKYAANRAGELGNEVHSPNR